MTDYKLVPVEPTPEMLAEIHIHEAFTRSALRARYQAMLAAAPDVQGEPASWLNIASLPHEPDEDQVFWFARSDGYVEGPREIQAGGYDYEEFEFYCPAVPPSLCPAPQPAEQQHHRDSAELRRLCQARDEQRDGRIAALERAAKALELAVKAEADVAGLVEALEDIGASWHRAGTRLEKYLQARARNALAAHRKGGEE